MVHSRMVIAMARQLMFLGGDPPHHVWMTLSNPAKRKEGRMYGMLRKQLKQAVDVGLYPAGYLIPTRTWNPFGQRLNLEIIFDVDRHGIERVLSTRRQWHKRMFRQVVLWPSHISSRANRICKVRFSVRS